MDCTGETRRKKICSEYNIKAIGCIVLYGGRTVISDAGGKVITDKYYKFLCTHKRDRHIEFIKCGYPTAKHICELCSLELSVEFNPFAGAGRRCSTRTGRGMIGRQKNQGRIQLYNAIMLFITEKDDVLVPNSPIFNIKDRVLEDMYSDVKLRDVKAVNTILGKFHTTMPEIIRNLGRYGRMRTYNFNRLIQMIDNEGIENNYR